MRHLLTRPRLGIALLGALTGTLIACSQQQPPTQPAATPKAAAGTAAPPAAPSTPAAASPAARAASPATAPVAATAAAASPVARVDPKGRLVYGLDFTLTPTWLDPQENPASLSPYSIQYAVHDAMVKHLPGKPFSPALAESFEMATDFKSATFRLRPGVKFHDGSPVTPADVKFTFESYKGANAKALKDRTASIETPDARTIKFNLTEPFLDFMVLYGTPASGAGWIVPEKYYKEVGPNGFKQKPIGAGPYKLIRQSGDEFELEAFADYWRKTPSVKTLIMRGIPEGTTRVAAFQTGEADFIQSIPGELVETVRSDSKLTIAPVQSSPWWLEMIGSEQADSPFNKRQVREAVSLALDRQALSDAETAGLSKPFGNWILGEWPGAIEWPVFPHDPARAKQLLAEAGYPNGFEVESLTPLPPFFSLGERVITQLREVGIRTRLNQMERAAFQAKTGEGPNAFSGFLLMNSAAPGDAASWIRAYTTCKGTSSRTCLPEIDEPFSRFEKSVDPKEREQILNGIQRYILENHVLVPVYRLGSPKGVGPRIANPWQEVFASIPQYFFVGPYEDVRLKE